MYFIFVLLLAGDHFDFLVLVVWEISLFMGEICEMRDFLLYLQIKKTI